MKKQLQTLTMALSLLGAGQATAINITAETDAIILSNHLTGFGTSGILVSGSTVSYGTTGPIYDGEDGPIFDGEDGPIYDGEDGFTSVPPGAQTGTYSNLTGTYNLPGPGIVLSTGNVENYADGPSTSGSFTSSWNTTATADQAALLDPVSGSGAQFYDVVQLDIEFDVAANVNEISFLSVFGSEEFPNFVGSTFNDGFGLYLNGNNIAGVEPSGGGTPLTVNINHPDFSAIPGTELNGVLAPNENPVLRFDTAVTPGSTGNILTVILGDRGDMSYDTTVYLASLGATGSSEFIPVMPNNGEANADGSFEFDIIIGADGLGIDTPIWIDPIIAVGYVYEVNSGEDFASVTFPSLAAVNDTTGYDLYRWDEILLEYVLVGHYNAEDTHIFVGGVSQFKILGIDTPLELDPSDPNAFMTGLTFTGSGPINMSMTPITYDTNASSAVPVPSAIFLFLAGIPLLLVASRRKTV